MHKVRTIAGRKWRKIQQQNQSWMGAKKERREEKEEKKKGSKKIHFESPSLLKELKQTVLHAMVVAIAASSWQLQDPIAPNSKSNQSNKSYQSHQSNKSYQSNQSHNLIKYLVRLVRMVKWVKFWICCNWVHMHVWLPHRTNDRAIKKASSSTTAATHADRQTDR